MTKLIMGTSQWWRVKVKPYSNFSEIHEMAKIGIIGNL